ncbi:MAG: ribonuclease P protein component 4 [Candidatus Nanohaloarchaea archaeon]
MSHQIAEERIRILFEEAEKRPEYMERYLKLAERIGMRAEASIPSELKKKYCSSCYSLLTPGENCRVRVISDEKIVSYRCLECGEEKRYGYS